MRMPLISCALLFCASTFLAAQQTIIVQGSFDSFQKAVAVAKAGDVLIVRPGTYDGFAVINEGISVLCDPGVLFSATGTRGTGLTIASVPSGQVFRMRGGSFFGVLLNPLSIIDCQGSVVLEGTGAAPGLNVLRNHSVALTSCGLGVVRVEDSTVAFVDCTMKGEPCNSTRCGAVTALRSSISIVGGSAIGSAPLLFLPAGSAIFVDNSEVTIAGDASTIVRSGNGPVGAIASTTGRVTLGPSVTITAGGAQLVTGNAKVVTRDIPSVTATGVLAGQVFTARSHAQVGSSVHMLASLPTMLRPTLFGTLWVSIPSLVLDSGIAPASGVRTVSIPLPSMSRGVPLVLQPIVTLTSGEIIIGTAVAVVLN